MTPLPQPIMGHPHNYPKNPAYTSTVNSKEENPGGKPSCILGWENFIIRHRYTYYKNERRKRKEIGTGGREGRKTDEKNTSLFWETTPCFLTTIAEQH